MSFYIGNVFIDKKTVLAPMAGVTQVAYRRLCHQFGAGLVYSEMISDKGIHYHDKKTLSLLQVAVDEHPMAIQIFGGDLTTLLEAAKFVDQNTDADIIDINMGCPVPKVTKTFAGSYYLLDPERIFLTVKTIVLNVSKPVTVKIRIGWDHHHINALEVSRKIYEAGASAICIHGRTKSDLYSGKVDYEIIRRVKESLGQFPIIANGDIKTPEQAKEILDFTNCDAVMIGRASYGNPYLFTQINTYLETVQILENLSEESKINLLKSYADDLIKLKGEYIAIQELRKQAGWFLKGFYDSTTLRNELSHMTSFAQFLAVLEKLK